MIECSKCGAHMDRVIDSRPGIIPVTEEQTIRRRRECKTCGHRISTCEVDLAKFHVKSVSDAERHKIMDKIASVLGVDLMDYFQGKIRPKMENDDDE